jgi:tetratricopeptide (TPR) repeat protein
MNTGYQATKTQDYQKALANFQEALKLRPNDVYASKAIRNLKSYIYDYYMEQGYVANNERDYQGALNYFQKAAQARPNDFYVQQAIRNVQKLAQRGENISANNSVGQEKNIFSNFLFILMLLLTIISICLILVIIRLSRLKSSAQNMEQLKEIVAKSALNTNNSLVTKSAADQVSKEEKLPAESTEQQELTVSKSNLVSLQSTSPLYKPDIVEELLLALQDNDPKKRRKAIWELAQKGDSRAIKPLVQMMINANSYELSLILEALSQISTSSMKPLNQALLISLQDNNPQVRKNAIRDLTKIYDLVNQIYPLINHVILNDPDQEVREIAHWALEKFTFKERLSSLESSQQEVNATLITDNSAEN